jgi:hypothetical protein
MFTHPFTGEEMERRIVGLDGDSCTYEEQMPQNGQMRCTYSESVRVAVAEYYRVTFSAEESRTEVHIEFPSGETGTRYTIDGREVGNPLNEAMSNGDCVISGY